MTARYSRTRSPAPAQNSAGGGAGAGEAPSSPAGPLAALLAETGRPAPRRASERGRERLWGPGPRPRRPRRHWLLAGPSIPPARAPGGGGAGGSAAPVGRWPGCVFRGRARSLAPPLARISPTGLGRALRGRDEPRGLAQPGGRGRSGPRGRSPGRCVCVPLPSFTLCRLLALARFYCPDAKIVMQGCGSAAALVDVRTERNPVGV